METNAVFGRLEIWPNLISLVKKKISLAIINAGLRKTFDRWNLFPNFAKKYLIN